MRREDRKENCCEVCGEEWQPSNFGSPRRCAFDGEGFGPNWNCGLVSRIREEIYNNQNDNNALRYRNDDGIGSVGALVIEIPGENPDNPCFDYVLCGLLVSTWYKDRGATESMEWAVQDYGFEDDAGRELTKEQAVKIVEYLNQREKE